MFKNRIAQWIMNKVHNSINQSWFHEFLTAYQTGNEIKLINNNILNNKQWNIGKHQLSYQTLIKPSQDTIISEPWASYAGAIHDLLQWKWMATTL